MKNKPFHTAEIDGYGAYTWRTDMDRAEQCDMLIELLTDGRGWSEADAHSAARQLGEVMAEHDKGRGRMSRSKNYDLTPAMIDIVVVLSGAGHQALPAEQISVMSDRGHISKPLAGLKQRGLIQEGAHTYAFRHPHTRQRTWKIRWEGIPDPLWGRIMVDHARRHSYNVRDVMSEDDLKRCEIAA